MNSSEYQFDPILRWCLIVLTMIATFVALSIAQNILAPMLLGLVVGVILSPLTAFLERIGLSRGLSAIAVVLLGILCLGLAIFLAEPIVWKIIDEIPRIQAEIRG